MSGDKYKLYKLRSGEEIVSKVVSTTSKKVTLFRPMQVKMSTLLDRNSGMTRDIVLLRRWLDNTFEINCELPLDYVALELKPTPDLISRYLMELEREDAYYDAMRDMEEMKGEEGDEPQASEFLERLMNDLENLKEANDSVEEMMEQEDMEEENHIMMNFLLPPEIFLNIMNTINIMKNIQKILIKEHHIIVKAHEILTTQEYQMNLIHQEILLPEIEILGKKYMIVEHH